MLIHLFDLLRGKILRSLVIILLSKLLTIVVNLYEHRLVSHVLLVNLEHNSSSENEVNVGAWVALSENDVSLLVVDELTELKQLLSDGLRVLREEGEPDQVLIYILEVNRNLFLLEGLHILVDSLGFKQTKSSLERLVVCSLVYL